MKKLFFFLPAALSLLAQDRTAPVRRAQPVESAIEFTTTSNASQAGVSFVTGYQFTVKAPVTLTALGAVLRGSSAQPVFGALPASMPVALWDDAQNLMVSATVSAADPMTGHFNYIKVRDTLLLPGIKYTVAGLVAPGESVLSDVPELLPGSLIAYGGPRSLASTTLVFPGTDAISRPNSYFGVSFTYADGKAPVARSGSDRNVTPGETVKLDGSASFAQGGGSLTWSWRLSMVPPGSAAALSGAGTANPFFVADREGLYVAELIVHDGREHSVPSTVSIIAAAPTVAGK